MKTYYVSYWHDFANTYNLLWAETPKQLAALPTNAKRITRREAFRLASAERYRRKTDHSFSGYADSLIWPADCDPIRMRDREVEAGYIAHPRY